VLVISTWVAFVIGVSSVLLLKMFILQFWRARPYLDQQDAIQRVEGLARQGIEKGGVMLWTVAAVLLVLWALGMGTSYTAGGLVHLLLVIAAVVVVFQFIGGRRTVWQRPADVRGRPPQEDVVRSVERSRRQDNDESPASRSR
jgi:Family of unknown function (DUF5670)